MVSLDAAGTTGTWVALAGDRVISVGSGPPPPGEEIIDVVGVVYPGFIDAHVHLTATGLFHNGLNLRESRSVNALLDALKAYLRIAPDGIVMGGNFDPGRNEEGEMPTRSDLDKVAGARPVFISRTDGHSSAVGSALLESLRLDLETDGLDRDPEGNPTGILRSEANYEARRRIFALMGDSQIRACQEAACNLALSMGVTSLHEMAGTSLGERDFALLASEGDHPVHVVTYLATLDVERVAALNVRRVGGDLFLDGSLGSRTAALLHPYSDGDGSGRLYHSDEEVGEFFYRATRLGLQAGVHAIGDGAVEQAISAVEETAARLGDGGVEQVRRLRHRIEHFECVDDEQLSRAASLGIIASVQPAFDHYWGGERGMYAARLGERARAMNPFARMISSGLTVAGGSDSTVTPLDPFLGMRSAVEHHREDFRVGIKDALLMFTGNAAFAAHDETSRGSLSPGKYADMVVLTDDPVSAPLDQIEVVETWVGGRRVWPHGEENSRS